MYRSAFSSFSHCGTVYQQTYGNTNIQQCALVATPAILLVTLTPLGSDISSTFISPSYRLNSTSH